MTGATLVIQATTSRQAQTGGRHRKPSSRRWNHLGNRTGRATIAALLAAFVLSIGLAVKLIEEAPEPVADAGQSPSVTAAVPIQPVPSEPAGPPAASEPRDLFATDDKGFVNSGARCDGKQTAAAIGRTERSVVVICVGDHGRYEYLGVRLSDNAILRTAAETTPTRGFLARTASATYAVSPSELLVTAGAMVVKKERMLEYRGLD